MEEETDTRDPEAVEAARDGPMSGAERARRYRAKKGAARRTDPVCGEMSGVWAHQNSKESLCDACRPVWAEYQREHYDPKARADRYRANR